MRSGTHIVNLIKSLEAKQKDGENNGTIFFFDGFNYGFKLPFLPPSLQNIFASCAMLLAIATKILQRSSIAAGEKSTITFNDEY